MSDEYRSDATPTDAERARAVREQLKSVHAFDLAYEMMISLVSFGYQKMGLTDETGELRDLGDARLAIELLRANLEVVEREQGEERTRDVRSTLAQMQLGYARAVQLAGDTSVGQAPAAEAAAEAPDEDAPAANGAAAMDGSRQNAPPKSAAGKPAAKKAATKKPAVKKTAAKKTATKRPAGGATPSTG